MNCKTSFISQVLNGHLHFSLEQGELVAQFCGLGSDESFFYLLLVQRGRAGTESLRKVLDAKISEAKILTIQLKAKITIRDELTQEDQIRFYSSWLYSAVHVALTIPRLNTVAALSEHFKQPKQVITDVLSFMVSAGIATQNGAAFAASIKCMHIGHDQALIHQNHVNWRVKTIAAFDQGVDPSNLHYSSVVTISRQDAERIRSDLMKAIVDAKETICVSPDEVLYSFNMDFFALK